MKRPQLSADKREVFGKKLKKIRREGLLPANVYGKGLESTALQVKLSDFESVYKEVGETGLIDLQFDGKVKPVLIKNLQSNYKENTPLHADFYQVNLKEKVKTVVPVILTGEAQAVTDNVGMLLQTQSDVEVEALPDSLPEKIEIDVTALAELNQQITVADLLAPEGVTILTDPAQVVAKVGELVVEEPEPEETEGEEGAEGEAATGEEGESKEESSEEGAEENKESSEEKPQSNEEPKE